MDFQRARTEKQIANRQDEIISACDAIYEKDGFEDVTFKKISDNTSFARSSIYNYYTTKEEIFLDLLKRDYLAWHTAFKTKFDDTPTMTKETFCRFLTDSLLVRERMLQLMSVYLTTIENNCSDQRLGEFKKSLAAVMGDFSTGLAKYFPAAPEENRAAFQLAFFAYVHGLYPLTHPSKKQKKAMAYAGYGAPAKFDDLCYSGLLLLAAAL